MKKIFIFLAMLVSLAGCAGSDTLNLYENTYSNYLNTSVKLKIYYEDSVKIDKLVEEVEEVLISYDKEYNAYSEKSTLAYINNNAYNEAVEVDDLMYEIIELSLEYASLYPDAYDPTILPIAMLWDIDSDSYYTGGTVPSEEDIKKTLEVVGYEYVVLDEANKTVSFTKEGVMLDLGSIVKGYVAKEILDILNDYEIKSAIVDVGSSSQIIIGTRPSLNEQTGTYEYTEDYFNIGLADPEDILGFGQIVGYYEVSDIAISSSGISRQYFEVDGVKYHHIFSPVTGYPVDNNLESVQIYTDNYLAADAISTMVFALGLDEGMAYVEATEGVEALFLTKDKRIYLSSNAPKYNQTNTDYTVRSYK